MGLKFLHGKRKTGRDLCFTSPCFGPAQQHMHVFVLLFSAAITQQPGKSLAHQGRLRMVIKYPKAGWPPGLLLEWCDQGVHHCAALPWFGHFRNPLAHLGTQEWRVSPLTHSPSSPATLQADFSFFKYIHYISSFSWDSLGLISCRLG